MLVSPVIRAVLCASQVLAAGPDEIDSEWTLAIGASKAFQIQIPKDSAN